MQLCIFIKPLKFVLCRSDFWQVGGSLLPEVKISTEICGMHIAHFVGCTSIECNRRITLVTTSATPPHASYFECSSLDMHPAKMHTLKVSSRWQEANPQKMQRRHNNRNNNTDRLTHCYFGFTSHSGPLIL